MPTIELLAEIAYLKQECTRLKIGYDRYEKLRKLNAQQFTELYRAWFRSGKTFDEMVDELEV